MWLVYMGLQSWWGGGVWWRIDDYSQGLHVHSYTCTLGKTRGELSASIPPLPACHQLVASSYM